MKGSLTFQQPGQDLKCRADVDGCKTHLGTDLQRKVPIQRDGIPQIYLKQRKIAIPDVPSGLILLPTKWPVFLIILVISHYSTQSTAQHEAPYIDKVSSLVRISLPHQLRICMCTIHIARSSLA